MEKIFKGIIVSILDGKMYCNFDDYIKARNKQNKTWSEKSFCNWCNKYNIVPVG